MTDAERERQLQATLDTVASIKREQSIWQRERVERDNDPGQYAREHRAREARKLMPDNDGRLIFKKRETLAQPPDWSEWEKWMRGHQLAEREVIFGSVAPTLVAHNTELQALKIEVAVVRDQLDALTKLL